MKKIRADFIVDRMEDIFPSDFQPRLAVEVIREICKDSLPDYTEFQLFEYSENLLGKVIQVIHDRRSCADGSSFGYYYGIDVHPSNDEVILGSCFVLPSDSEAVKASKRRRATYKEIATSVSEVSFTDFETLCAAIIRILGVEDATHTTTSNDQGIDFFGKWELEQYFKASALPSGFEKQFSVWVVGQAKKYDKVKISTAEIRELVGSIELARMKTFSNEVTPLDKLSLRACDPVFYMFLTTGNITSGVARLLEKAGIIFMDRNLIGMMLADRVDLAICDIRKPDELRKWIGTINGTQK